MTRAFEKQVSVPEQTGIIMVIEKEFGPAGAKDWAGAVTGLANVVKCTFGTGALYDEDVLKQKLAAYADAGISTMIGGTLTEVAILDAGGYDKDRLGGYLEYAKGLGFTHLEFSDGTIYIPDEDRGKIIRMCIDAGFKVISEVGKKDPKKDEKITLEQRTALMKQDLVDGSEMVIIEARESGKGIGVMGKGGEVDFAELDAIIEAVGLDKTMIEAPDKSQQQNVFMRYGPAANIGNVQPRDVLSAAALRGGLRGDTISALRKEQWTQYHASVKAPEDYA
ncbi:MAG: phosphosulfolactate synthase [Lentisphaerae bacterium]|nr:phosphosulfolactate synthase [Lentisphaerota bacterium]